jgi:hypothetical protein
MAMKEAVPDREPAVAQRLASWQFAGAQRIRHPGIGVRFRPKTAGKPRQMAICMG